jgi:hypothetical protein
MTWPWDCAVVIPKFFSAHVPPIDGALGAGRSIARKAALLVESAQGVSIVNCTFNQTGGNAVMFSNHVVDSQVTDSEFVFTGDSGKEMLARGMV